MPMIGRKQVMNALKKSRLANRIPTGPPRKTNSKLPDGHRDPELPLGFKLVALA